MPSHELIILHNSDGYIRDGHEIHEALVTLITLLKTFSYIFFAVPWLHSTLKLCIATIMM